jgi:tetratricopeptide (TPR) repeat protein
LIPLPANVDARRPASSLTLASSALLALLALCLAEPGQAHAQQASANASADEGAAAAPSPHELAKARQLFQRGVELAQKEQFGLAAQRFREALAIHQAPPVEYNLAAALFELGKHEEAFNRAQSVEHAPDASEALRARAQKLSRALYPHTARLTVTASSSSEEDVAVQIDNEQLARAQMGIPRAVSPGSHHIRAERQGKVISERDLQVPLRTAVIVDVSLIIAEAAAQQVAAVQTLPDADAPNAAIHPATEPHDDRDRKRRIRLWSGVAAGVVAIGAGVALAVVLSKDGGKQEQGVAGDFMPGVLTWK